MAIQLSTSARNGLLDAIETAAGTAPLFRIRTGAAPTNCAAARTGTILCSMTLPSDWWAAASGGTKTKSGTWSDVGLAAGTAAHFEIMDSAGSNCHIQGTVTATGGGGDVIIDNVSIAVGQSVTVTTFIFTAPGA